MDAEPGCAHSVDYRAETKDVENKLST